MPYLQDLYALVQALLAAESFGIMSLCVSGWLELVNPF